MLIHKNKKAYFDYEILDTHEAGIVLEGVEVKSVRNNQCHLKGAHVYIRNGEAWITGMHISAYKHGHVDLAPERERKLLLKKRTIIRLTQKLNETGLTLIPLNIKLKGPYIKIDVGLARGRKKHDKREVLKKRDQEREQRKVMSLR